MKPELFILIFIIIFLAANIYVSYRTYTLLSHKLWVRIAIGVLVVLMTFCFVAAYTFADNISLGLGVMFYKIGNSWLIALLYLVLIFLLLDIVRWCNLLPMDWMVKGSHIGFISVYGFTVLLLVTGNIVYHNKKRVELEIAISKQLASDIDVGLKIVMVSDLHLGYGIDGKELKSWVELINAENADVILICGDIIDSSTRPLWDNDCATLINGIKSRYGTYAVLGNHEYIAGIEKSLRFYEATNITLLRDSAVLVGNGFYIVGRDDRSNHHRSTLADLTRPLDHSLPIILLDHQPYDLEEAEKCGIDLQLSGHTHQGQVFPASMLTKALYEDDHGYMRRSDTHYYVSSGLGIWGGKFRIGTRSEYAVITIKGEK